VPNGTLDASHLLVSYRLEEQLALDASLSRPRIERWDASVFVDADEIGYAQVLVFNLEAGGDIRDLADAASGTWIDVHSGSRPPGSSGGAALESQAETHVLLLDRVWLHPDYRGQGLGPIVALTVIDRLGRGCHLAACYPAPFEDPDQSDDDRNHAIQSLGRLWSKVGFQEWRDGVWMLDLAHADLRAALGELLAARKTGLLLRAG
jgi:GNAT superfamily N-acetyltransferase